VSASDLAAFCAIQRLQCQQSIPSRLQCSLRCRVTTSVLLLVTVRLWRNVQMVRNVHMIYNDNILRS
jgi:hypothetical protein